MKLSCRRSGLIAFMICVGLPLAARGEGNKEHGAKVYQSCLPCHGADAGGSQLQNTPRLAGQHGWYLSRQLQNMKKGLRGYDSRNTYTVVMRGIAAGLSDQDIEDVVAYIDTLEASDSPATVKGDLVAGKELFLQCKLCHGADGRGWLGTKTPNLTIQHDWYLLRQLENYRLDYRGTHPEDNFGGRMWAIARTIESEQALSDIVAYLKSLGLKDERGGGGK